MGKRHIQLRIVIQGLIIAITAMVLLILRNAASRADEPTLIQRYADFTLAAFFVGTALIFIVNTLFVVREKRRNALDHEDLKKLKARAQIDSLTGLYNRETVIEQITDYLGNAGRSKPHALILVDLDNFKKVNDSFGHFEGDKVLQALSEKIRSVFRAGDIVGRLGGDEFIVLMKEAASRSDVHRKALELQNALEYMMSGDGVTVTVTASIGIAYTEDGGSNASSFDQFYREADEALYKAKFTGKNRYSFFNEKTPDPDQARSALTASSAGIELKALIDNIDGGIALLEIGQDIRSIYLSRSYVRMMHLSYDGIKKVDNRVLTFIHPEDIAMVEEMLRRGTETCIPVESVFRRLADGKAKWYHIRAVRIAYDYSDKPVLIAIVTDVTNLKETELKYKSQKKQLDTVLRVSHVVTFEVDIASRSLHLSEATAVKYGIDTYVIENMPDSMIDAGAIHPDSADECRRMYDEIYAGVPEGSAIIRTLRRNGEYSIDRFTYFTVKDGNGKPVKAVGVAEEMETHGSKPLRVSQLERQFRFHSESLLASIKVALSDDSYVFLKADDQYRPYESKFQTYMALLQALTDHLAAQPDREYFMTAFSLEGLRRSFSENKTILGHEYRILAADGSLRWNYVSVGLHKNELDGEVYAFIRLRDITRKKELEAEYDVFLGSGEHGLFSDIETIRRMGDAIITSKKQPCAVALLTVANYEDMLAKYGRLLMNDLIFGFVGKAAMLLKSEYFSCYDWEGHLTVLLTDMASAASAAALMEEIVKYLKNPAFFQFREEEYMEYACGIAISNNSTPDFAVLYDDAERATR